MLNKFLVTAIILAILAIASAVVPYIATFGGSIIFSHEKWGQFGDYFGGVLNPIFAMFAFGALLYSISLQIKELRAASAALATQAESAKTQLSLTRESRTKDDFLSVLQDIDERISLELKVLVTQANAHTVLYISHMASEARRLRGNPNAGSDSYKAFISIARTEGSVAEAAVREINILLNQMREFLSLYSRLEENRLSPVVMYYARKCLDLLYMLEDIGLTGPDLRQFFNTIGDEHG